MITLITLDSNINTPQAFSRFGGLLQVRGSGNVAMQRLSREGLLWAPCIGNVCTFMAFLLALVLNSYVTGAGRRFGLRVA